MPSSSTILIVFTFLGSFLVVWASACKIISLFGWNDLAKRHTAINSAQGTRHSGQSATIGRLGRYHGCVTIHTSQAGIHLALFPIFRVGHPPLFFPWSAIRLLKQQKGLFGRRFLYDLGTPRVRRISLQDEVHHAIQRQQNGVGRL